MAEQSKPTDANGAARQKLVETMEGFRATQVIYVAAKLAIADLLADEPKSIGELAEATSTNAHALHRLMRALVTLGVCEEPRDGVFGLAPAGQYLRTGVPGSVRYRAMHCGQLWPIWGELLYSITTGESARKRLTQTAGFEHLSRDPEAAEIFNGAMAEITREVGAAVVRTYDFSQIRTIVDVGGGYGTLVATILKANPHMRGKVLDMAHAADGARQLLEKFGVADRCEFVEGSFFESVPAGADAYILKSIIHDWDDERSVAILKTCRRAMGPNARLLIVERVMPERLGTSAPHRAMAFGDLNMLVAPGGQERTETEFRRLFEQSGFRLVRLVPAGLAGIHVIEAACA
jgi:ubiquinone/menaquinone biosynthesis C-methylase UbiE